MPGFTPLSSRLDNLPLIIAGPILRRVDYNSVTVWVTLKESRTVTLVVWDSQFQRVLNHSEPTKQFGEHLHIIAITASSGTNVLHQNELYFYNLQFDSDFLINEDGSFGSNIFTTAAYSFESLTYSDNRYPSFVLPPDNLDHLKFVHASCRKPHGGETDALRGLDTILSGTVRGRTTLASLDAVTRTAELYKRPQFICLTGDQIYADDVADSLLYLTMDAATALMGWDNYLINNAELLPRSLTSSVDGHPNNPPLIPGNRHFGIARIPNNSEVDQFSSDAARSHLIRLGEFYAMYLFVWSDVLWPNVTTDFPTVDRIVMGGAGRPNDEDRTLYDTQKASLISFHSTLKLVRKAMANIPNYMMFDDHDVTDDWFLTKEWVENTLNANLLTKRIMVNALSAYTIFQAWGNTPQRFASGEGLEILSILQDLNESRGRNSTSWEELGTRILPILNNYSGRNFRLEGGFPWDFYIDFTKFRLLFLDTRTKRGFSGETSPSVLISTSVLANSLHITNIPDTHELVVLISPAPIFGHHKVDRIQEAIRLPTGMYYKDQEAWIFNRIAFERLLDNLSNYQRVLILSGDVHYSFSVNIKYWNFRDDARILHSAMVGLTCSSLKNSTLGQIGTVNIGNGFGISNLFSPLKSLDDDRDLDVVGWQRSGLHLGHTVYSPIDGQPSIERSRVTGSPAMANIEFQRSTERSRRRTSDEGLLPSGSSQDYSADSPEWGYRITFARDQRDSRDRGTTASSGGSGIHVTRGDFDEQRFVVGRDTIGLVKFTDWPNRQIDHELWYANDPAHQEAEMHPYTIHRVYLNIPDVTALRPGEE